MIQIRGHKELDIFHFEKQEVLKIDEKKGKHTATTRFILQQTAKQSLTLRNLEKRNRWRREIVGEDYPIHGT